MSALDEISDFSQKHIAISYSIIILDVLDNCEHVIEKILNKVDLNTKCGHFYNIYTILSYYEKKYAKPILISDKVREDLSNIGIEETLPLYTYFRSFVLSN